MRPKLSSLFMRARVSTVQSLRFAKTALLSSALIMCATSQSVLAAMLVETGTISGTFGNETIGIAAVAGPFVSGLQPGETARFRFEFTNAELMSLDYFQAFGTCSEFWVETSPGVFDLGFGPDEALARCTILPNESCSVSNAGIARGRITLAHSGNVISGTVGYDRPNFNDCYGRLFEVVGPICSEENRPNPMFGNLPTGLLANFNLANGDGAYRFTITTDAVPEPASWAMMIAGFGLVGGAMRRRRRCAVRALA